MPALIRIRLSLSEKQGLIQQQARMQSSRFIKRACALLLLDAGTPTDKVLKALAISRRTLVNWKNRWLKGRRRNLEDKKHTGRPPKASGSYVAKMIRAVGQDPRSFGYVFTRWTAPRLVAYLYHATGIRLTAEWLNELLRMHGLFWRKTKRTLRNLQNPAEIERAKRQLRRLKRGRSTRAPIMNFGSAMASASTCCP
jgi:transposase